MIELNIFISYSHKDENFKDELLKYLKPLEREKEYIIKNWHDREINPGKEYDKEIMLQLESSQIILLLVSQDFISSNYCFNKEMGKALELHKKLDVKVIPIILRECSWDSTPLKELVALPQDGKPIQKWDYQESAFMDIRRGIDRIIHSFLYEKNKKPGDDIISGLQEPKLKDGEINSKKNKNLSLHYRETIYDKFAGFYDIWYEGHWQNDQPYKSICSIISLYYEYSRGFLNNLKILDVACGTGNTYIAFKRAGMDVYGTDGSKEMLEKAIDNCRSRKISTDKLISEPISWTDYQKFKDTFGEEQFDIIINTANSFCHLPPTDNQMIRALDIFKRLLKKGGLILIDTKKYITCGNIDDLPIYKELRYLASDEEWIERDERQEYVTLSDGNEVCFHTKMYYDISPAFEKKVQRAFIILSIFGKNSLIDTMVIPYYPLPARILKTKMEEIGLKTKVFSGFKEPLLNWKYDIVVGQK